MDLRRLEYFLAVADAQSFSRAAARLGVSQPALSRQVGLLEAALGTRLFDRHGRGVHLSEAGALLRERTVSIFRQLQQTRDEVAARAAEPAGEVGLAIPPSLRTMLTGRVAYRFRASFPKVFLRIAEGTTFQMRELVSRGEADVGLISTVEPDGDLVCSPLLTERLCLVGPAKRRLRFDRPIDAAEIARVPLIVTPSPNSLRRLVDGALARIGLAAQPALEATMGPLIVHLIGLGAGYTVLPCSAILQDLAMKTICAAPVKGLDISWRVATARERPLSVASRRLVETVIQEAQSAVRSGEWPTARLDT